MSIFAQTVDGDFALTRNHLTLVDGIDEVKQLLTNNFRTFQGEERQDLELGVPYMQKILDKTTPVNISQAILEDVARNTAGVKDVTNFSLNLDKTTRNATVTFNAVSEAGPIAYEGIFP
jgi:ATP phosphoribosyltransferase